MLANFAQTWGLVCSCWDPVLCVIAYALCPRNKKQFEEAARVPLQED
jgi:cytochrome c oxidase cbb3-type subunit IV